jgi:hypothetical protein
MRVFFFLNSYWFLAPILFSIIALTIRPARIDQQEYFYSLDIQINTTCTSKRESNITLIFQSSLSDETKRYLSPFKRHIICENLTYGMINNYHSRKIYFL